MNSFYTISELKELGFNRCGSNILISKKCSIYGAEHIVLGSNVRIDDFCILSGAITLGSYIHISAQTMFFGGNFGIELEDFVTVSSRCAFYAENDDYSGESPANPMIPAPYRETAGGKISLKKHVIIGSGCTVLPGVTLAEGCAVGAMSLVKQSLDEWALYAGIPCRRINERSRNLLNKLPPLVEGVSYG